MTLLITIFAAVIATIYWYNDNHKDMKLEILCFMFWGASIMWFVDAVFEYVRLKEDYFTPTIKEMCNDTYLGLSVIALALIIWIVILLWKDPKGVIKQKLRNR